MSIFINRTEFQEVKKEVVTEEELNQLRDRLEELNAESSVTNHIFYCSRTHAQINQVVGELKRNNFLMQRHGEIGMFVHPQIFYPTSYYVVPGQQRTLSMVVLASKQRYCIYPPSLKALEAGGDVSCNSFSIEVDEDGKRREQRK